MLPPDRVADLLPAQVESYLTAQGWRKAATTDLLSTWIREHRARVTGHLALPQNPHLPDYRRVLALAIDTIARVDGTYSAEVVEDIRASNFDTVRVRLQGQEYDRGRVALVHAGELVDGVKTLFFAGAATVERREAVFHGRSTRRVESYINSLEIAPPEKGSFVVRVLAPLPSSLDEWARVDTAVGDEPFSRTATAHVLQSVEATVQAATEAKARGVEKFKDYIERGVNANVCEALSDMSLGSPNVAVTVAASWSLRRPVQGGGLKKVIVPPDLLPVIERAAPLLRGKNPDDPVEVVGLVHLLKEDKDVGERAVGLTNSKNEWPRRVRVRLTPSQYGRAIQAHGSDSLVRVVGVVRRRGSFSYIDEPHRFEVIPPGSLDESTAAVRTRNILSFGTTEEANNRERQ